jgi:thioesterase domain-containing protein
MPSAPSALRRFLRERLPAQAIPSAFVVLDALPLTPTGNVDRKALPAPIPGRPELSVAFVPPRDATEARLAAIWEELLGVRPIGVKDDFFELSGHSLLAAQMFLRIGQSFGKNLPLSALFGGATIEQLARRLSPDGPSPSRPSLVPIRAEGSRPPFYCVHGIGGEVVSYERLVHALAECQPVYGFQSRATGGAEPLARIEEMASAYLEELHHFQPVGPYYLGGYSCGAAVDFEMAQQLRDSGHEVALLVIIDQRRPNLDPGYSWSPAALLGFLRNIPPWVRYDLRRTGPREILSRMKVKAGMIGRRLAGLSGAGPRRGPSASDMFDLSRIPGPFQALLEANYRALRGYTPRPYPGRVALLRARAQPLFRWHEPWMGWGNLLTGPVEFEEIPGAHDNFLTEPHVRCLARALESTLDRAHRREGQRIRSLVPAQGGRMSGVSSQRRRTPGGEDEVQPFEPPARDTQPAQRPHPPRLLARR